jgi:signal transduction histidine kinase
MEFFASDEQLAQLEAQLQAAEGAARLPCLVAVAWAVRQRDCARALALADEAEGSLAAGANTAGVGADTAQGLRLRLLLVRGEVKWLFGEFDASLTLAEQALHGFTGLESSEDALGCADAHWLRAWVAVDQGNLVQTDTELAEMARFASARDPVRFIVAQAMMARRAAFVDIAAATASWAPHFANLQQRSANLADQAQSPLPPAALCWVEDFWGIATGQKSEYLNSINHLSKTYAHALASGQIRRAIVAAINIGDVFHDINDHHTALDWVQRALSLARHSGWPNMIGIALMQTASAMRRLQQNDGAYDLLREALSLMRAMAESRNYALALRHLGDVELAREQYPNALATFQLLEQRALLLMHADLQCWAKRGQAQALLGLGQATAALHAGYAALAGANTTDQIITLRVLADIHSRYPLPPPVALPKDDDASIYYLQRAIALAQTMGDNIVPIDLLDSLAKQYAKLGHYQKAWEFGQQAALARERFHSRETTNRALALQLTFATEQAQAEAAHQRHLAEAEARRAAVLEQTSDTLTHLGLIGQEITAHLDAQHVFEALHHHVKNLFNATAIAIYIMNENGRSLTQVFGMEDNQPLPQHSVPLTNQIANAARCARERRDILLNDNSPLGIEPSWLPGTLHTRSAIFAPLIQANRVLGVMTIQSTRPNAYAYGEREQMICRTLCAYTAIALSNADAHGQLSKAHTDLADAHTELAHAHRQLQDTQQQLILQGKMAGLGSLTAGVAHEINNPTNFAHVAAQNMAADIAEFRQYVAELIEADDAPDIVQGFNQRFDQINRNVGTMLNGTGRIKGIVRDLRAFTRMDSEKKRPVRLSECLTSTLNLVRTSWLEKVEFITEFEPDPEIPCWPALLNQVFMNLLVNGCQAIEARHFTHPPPATSHAESRTDPRGKLWLRLFRQGQLMLIEFEDSGTGISPEAQARIMEPFYTTKEVGKGTGLGLSIAFDIIQKHGGTLSFSSLPGHGSCFTIQLPLA